MRQMASRRGFTLVELLVVIGIISVLISVLLPTLSKTRAAAQKVACASNIRQLCMATLMYVNDNNGVLMSRPNWNQGQLGEFGSSNAMGVFFSNYLRAKKADNTPDFSPRKMWCPSQNRQTDPIYFTYGYWAGGADDFPIKLNRATRTLARKRSDGFVVGVGGVALFADTVVTDLNVGVSGTFTNHWKNGKPDGGNVGFGDGSVRWMTVSSAWNAREQYVPVSGLAVAAPYNGVWAVMMGNTGSGLTQLRKPYGSYTEGYVQIGSGGAAAKDF